MNKSISSIVRENKPTISLQNKRVTSDEKLTFSNIFMDPISKLQKLQNAIITSNSNGINQAPKRISTPRFQFIHTRLKHHPSSIRKRFCDYTLWGSNKCLCSIIITWCLDSISCFSFQKWAPLQFSR